jgi:hypothetical protein
VGQGQGSCATLRRPSSMFWVSYLNGNKLNSTVYLCRRIKLKAIYTAQSDRCYRPFWDIWCPIFKVKFISAWRYQEATIYILKFSKYQWHYKCFNFLCYYHLLYTDLLMPHRRLRHLKLLSSNHIYSPLLSFVSFSKLLPIFIHLDCNTCNYFVLFHVKLLFFEFAYEVSAFSFNVDKDSLEIVWLYIY